MIQKEAHSEIALVVQWSSQSVASVSGRGQFPSVPANCFELGEGCKLVTM